VGQSTTSGKAAAASTTRYARPLAILRRVHWWRVAAILVCAAFWLAVFAALMSCTQSPPSAYLPVITIPPAAYRGDVASAVQFRADALATCGAPMCTRGSSIIAPNPCDYTGETYARGLCHELGHRNRWPGNHPLN